MPSTERTDVKDQYFGDVNDYRKYGLLRCLLSGGNLSLLVAWMLTPDDGGDDGKRRSYLHQPEEWKRYDRQLFDRLVEALRPPATPQVSLIEGSGLLPNSRFYREVVADGRSERDIWTRGLIESAVGADLVFVDPDNGIEIPSRPVGRKGSSKYVTWSEIGQLWQIGCSILIYQHFPHRPREAFAESMASELQRRTASRYVEAIRTTHVLFLLVSQPKHEHGFRSAVHGLASRWSGQMQAVRQGDNRL
jgi:hypothetical protein